MARLVTLLPDPDSPTRPTISPARRSRSRPFTACTDPAEGPERDRQAADLQQAARASPLPLPWVELRPQARHPRG